jgi:predicted glycogen debranching enzyme
MNLYFDEWLVTNGLGGFACGSIGGAPMRKHHALLISPFFPPLGRTILLNYVEDRLLLSDGREIPLSLLQTKEEAGHSLLPLSEFRLENGLPVWRFEFEDVVLLKSLFFVHRQNTIHIFYKLIDAKSEVKIKWRPYLHFRKLDDAVNAFSENKYTLKMAEEIYEIECSSFPVLRLASFQNSPFTIDTHVFTDVFYEIEKNRGYHCYGSLTSPGYFLADLTLNERVTFIASSEPCANIQALNEDEALSAERQRRKKILKTAHFSPLKLGSRLLFAADTFLMIPTTRPADIIRMQASGDEACSIIAGFPWFADWGRDTMISLEGLTLSTNQFQKAHAILKTFGSYLKDGLIPNLFPDGESVGLYHTADATLWFFHAIGRYVDVTGDTDLLEILLPKLEESIQRHIQGTHFGIKADRDGLLLQGESSFALTWMDAKVENWVVTPRRGKTVEINGLWYNALKLWESWTGKKLDITERCYESFNQRFWCEKGYLYDRVDGEISADEALRPNQLLAISLKYPVLEQRRWKSVLDTVQQELLTPFGLRTLSPSHKDYKAFYAGDLKARDFAYHQGTVWPWLLGPFIDVWLKVYPGDFKSVRGFLEGLEKRLESNTLGSLEEIFDGSDPFHARGCFAQAWSVAEFLRHYVPSQKIP